MSSDPIDPPVEGFQADPEMAPDNHPDPGRLTLPDIQIRRSGGRVMATATVNLSLLHSAVENLMLWTDQMIQRGIQPGLPTPPDIELPLRDGYPDPTKYIFFAERSDDIVQKLLDGEDLYLDPLVWNMRPGTFRAYYDSSIRRISIYDGKIFLPDSHHRHQAIRKAFLTYKEAPKDYPNFDPSAQFAVELYFMTREQEGDFFYQKNQLPKPTAKSKAYDITLSDPLAEIARLAIDLSPSLTGNVNRVTDRLTARNPQVVTLSTLREMVKTMVGAETVPDEEVSDYSSTLAHFFEILADTRPELGHMPPVDRKKVRDTLVVDQAVLMHGYASLMKDFYADRLAIGDEAAEKDWRSRLSAIKSHVTYSRADFEGDFFDRTNPLWREVGLLQPTKAGTLTVSNTRQTRQAAAAALRDQIAKGAVG